MHLRLILASATVVLSVLLNGCAKNSSEQDYGQPIASASASLSFEERIHRLHESPLASDCETSNFDKQLEMARALDQKATQIAAYQAQSFSTTLYNYMPLGPILVRERIHDLSEPPRNSWQEDTYSWTSLYSDFQNIVNDDDIVPWISFDRTFKYILDLEEDRLLYEAPFYYDPNFATWIEPLFWSLSTCAHDEHCTRPTYFNSTVIPSDFSGNSLYLQHSQAIINATGNTQKRAAIQQFSNIVSSDYWDRFQFKKNAGIRRTSPEQITVKMDAGPFYGERQQLAELMLQKWQSPRLSVAIEWVNKATEPTAFSVSAGAIAGSASYVSWFHREMILFTGLKKASLPHEFGHVLGFRDNYYYRWVPSHCSYTYFFRDDDLMSDSPQGIVTDEEWTKLDQMYPYPPAL